MSLQRRSPFQETGLCTPYPELREIDTRWLGEIALLLWAGFILGLRCCSRAWVLIARLLGRPVYCVATVGIMTLSLATTIGLAT